MDTSAQYKMMKDALARLINEVNSLSIGWDDLAMRRAVEGALSEAKAALGSGDEQAIDAAGKMLQEWKRDLERERTRV